MSKRQPSRWTVREMPPTTESASSTVLVTPALASSWAAVRPAGPAPMMTTLPGPSAVGVGPAGVVLSLTDRSPSAVRT